MLRPRPSRRATALLTAAMAAVALAAPVSATPDGPRATSPMDWVIAGYSGPEGTDEEVTFSWQVEVEATDRDVAPVLGVGWVDSTVLPDWIGPGLIPLGRSGVYAGTGPAGATRAAVSAGPGLTRVSGSYGYAGPLDEGQIFWLLLYVADGVFARRPTVDVSGWPGAQRVHVDAGHGSTAVRFTDGCDVGAGATVATPLGAYGAYTGTATCRTRAGAGIVGSFGWTDQDRGTWSATGPDGVEQTEWVVGPRGWWTWRFSGIRSGDVVAAYAPVGGRSALWAHDDA